MTTPFTLSLRLIHRLPLYPNSIFVTGVDEVDFDLYPNEAFQKEWLQIYLSERARLKG